MNHFYMSVKKSSLKIVVLLLLFNKGFSQEGLPVYFDYLSDNYYLVYPSMAGTGEDARIRLTARQQWFNVQSAPNLQTLSAHMRIQDTPSGVGVILFNDANGYHSQTGLKLTYAHHIMFFRDFVDINQLSFGLSAGFIQSRLDESEFISVVPDPAITGTDNSVGYFNVDAGVSYNFLDFYAHFAVKNIIGSGRDLYSAQEFDNLRRYLLSAGYAFGKTEWFYEPSFLLQFTEFTKEKTADLNIKVYREMDFGTLWGGLSYRRSFDGNEVQELELITPILGINYKNLVFAYTYSYQTGAIRADNGGYHQLTLGYNFWKKDNWRRSRRNFQRTLLGGNTP